MVAARIGSGGADGAGGGRLGGILSAGLSPEVIALVVCCVAAAAVSLVGAVRAAQEPEGSEAELLAGPFAVVLVAVAVSALLWTGWDAEDPAGLQQRAVSHGAAAFVLPLLGLPALGVSAVALGWLGWRGPRHWASASWVCGAGWLAAAAVALGGMGQPDVVFSMIRAAAMAGLTVPLALGAARSDERGPALRGVALGCLVMATGALETSHGGLVTLLVIGQVGVLTPDTWAEGLAAFDAIVHASRIASWGAVVAVAVAAVAGQRGAPRAVQGGVLASVVFALVLLGLSRPSLERMERLSVLCPEAATSR